MGTNAPTFIHQEVGQGGDHFSFAGSVLSFQRRCQVVETASCPPSNVLAGVVQEGPESLYGTTGQSRARLLLPAEVKRVQDQGLAEVKKNEHE